MLRRLFMALLLAAAACALAVAAYVVWLRAQPVPLPDGIHRANGRLELTRVDVAAKYPGRLASVDFEEGEAVQAGQVLAVQEDAELQARLVQAKAQAARAASEGARAGSGAAAQAHKVALARLEWRQAKKLLAQKQISPVEEERRRLALAAEEAALKAAAGAQHSAAHASEEAAAHIALLDAMLEALQLRAPIAGRVEYRLAEPGTMLAPGSRVATLLDASDASLTVFYPAPVAASVRVGDEARIVLAGWGGALPATVGMVDAQAQFTPKYVETRTEREQLMYRVKLRIPPEAALAWAGRLKGGAPGEGYVRTSGAAPWPAEAALLSAPKASDAPATSAP